MAHLKNGTTSSTGTASYSFPSGSFTHQKQANAVMPQDQRAKLLAMHRDGKANAGIYVAVVLVVYFILVIILLCRYGKRRRTPEPSSTLDSATEQGRFHLINFHLGKITSCGGDGQSCVGNLSDLCFGPCQRAESSSAKSATVHSQNVTSDGDKSMSVETQLTQLEKKDEAEGGKDNGVGKCHNQNRDVKGRTQGDTPTQEDDRRNEDSEESLEDD